MDACVRNCLDIRNARNYEEAARQRGFRIVPGLRELRSSVAIRVAVTPKRIRTDMSKKAAEARSARGRFANVLAGLRELRSSVAIRVAVTPKRIRKDMSKKAAEARSARRRFANGFDINISMCYKIVCFINSGRNQGGRL